jgi:hypothetical protein
MRVLDGRMVALGMILRIRRGPSILLVRSFVRGGAVCQSYSCGRDIPVVLLLLL